MPFSMMKASPKVKSNSAMWPFWWTRRSAYISMMAPRQADQGGSHHEGGPEADDAAHR